MSIDGMRENRTGTDPVSACVRVVRGARWCVVAEVRLRPSRGSYANRLNDRLIFVDDELFCLIDACSALLPRGRYLNPPIEPSACHGEILSRLIGSWCVRGSGSVLRSVRRCVAAWLCAEVWLCLFMRSSRCRVCVICFVLRVEVMRASSSIADDRGALRVA